MDHDENNLCTPKSWAAGTKKKDGFSRFGSISNFQRWNFRCSPCVKHPSGLFRWRKKIISPSKSVLRGAPEVVGILKILGPNLHGFQRGHVHLLPTNHCRWPVTKRGWINGPIPFVGSQSGHRYIVRTVWWNIYTTVVISGIKTWNWGAIHWQADVIHQNSELQDSTLVRTAICAQRFRRCVFFKKKQIRDLQILLPVEMEFLGVNDIWLKLHEENCSTDFPFEFIGSVGDLQTSAVGYLAWQRKYPVG